MKTQQEIEQLAENSSYNNSEHFEDYQDGMFYGYIKGYTQCQEDMVDVIDSLKKQLIKFQSKEPKYSVEGDYCAVCGSTEFWNNGDEEE